MDKTLSATETGSTPYITDTTKFSCTSTVTFTKIATAGFCRCLPEPIVTGVTKIRFGPADLLKHYCSGPDPNLTSLSLALIT